MRTIGQIMDENDGIGPGYDTLRLCLAFAVIFACFAFCSAFSLALLIWARRRISLSSFISAAVASAGPGAGADIYDPIVSFSISSFGIF